MEIDDMINGATDIVAAIDDAMNALHRLQRDLDAAPSDAVRRVGELESALSDARDAAFDLTGEEGWRPDIEPTDDPDSETSDGGAA